jgi:hypothetical protein
VDRRVAQGRSPLALDGPASSVLVSVVVGLVLVGIALFVYTLSHPHRFYNHFEWQAMAFLEGHAAIRYPVEATPGNAGNDFFQDVLPVATTDGVARGLVPFPPLPAVVLVPFMALWGFATDGQLVFAIVGAIDIGIAWWMLGRLPIRTWVRVFVTLFLAFGTVLWYAAQIGTTWYQAHVLAVGLAYLAIGLAIGRDPDAAQHEDDLWDAATDERQRIAAERRALTWPGEATGGGGGGTRLPLGVGRRGAVVRHALWPDRRQFLAGFVFGLACTARLTVVFAAPFFVLVGAGGSWFRRGWSAALGAGIPVALLVVYNVVTTGHVFHPGYQYLYELEAGFYTPLHYNLAWDIEDVRYLPQNLAIMFLNTPVWLPDVVPSALGLGRDLCTEPGAVRGIFELDCPLVLPRDTGMSILLTSPGYLLALPAIRWGFGRSRLITGAGLAVLIIAFVNLMHFSQGWVQFGYRFSLDFAPWLVVIVAIGLERIARGTDRWRPLAVRHVSATPAPQTVPGRGVVERSSTLGAWLLVGLAILVVVASILVNLWGTVWGDVLGW